MPPTITQKTLPTRQLRMELRDPRWRSVMNVNAAMAALDVDALEVRALIDEAWLTGFNIAVERDGRTELRVLVKSIDLFKAGGGARARCKPEFGFPEILKLMLPHTKPAILGTEIQRSLNCDSDHVLNLIRAGELKTVPGTDWQRGPGGSPSVLAASYQYFLKSRLL